MYEVEVISASTSSYIKDEIYDIKIVNLGENTTTFNSGGCLENKDDYYLDAVKKKLTFGRLSNYLYDDYKQQINFLFSVFVSKMLPENYSLPIKVSLTGQEFYYYDEFYFINKNNIYYAICLLNQTIEPSLNQIIPVIFNCTISGVYNMNKKYYLHFVSSYYINGDPKLVSLGTKYQYGSVLELPQANEMLPILSFTSINTEQCKEKGIILFKGKFQKYFEAELFYLYLLSGQNIFCLDLKPISDEEFEIYCILTDDIITNSRIAFQQTVITFTKEERFIIMPFYTEKKDFICIRGYQNNDIYKFEIDLSFRQVSKFQIYSHDSILFKFYGILNQDLYFEEIVSMLGNLIKNNESIETIARCVKGKIFIKEEGKAMQVEYDCYISYLDNVEDYSGYQIILSNLDSGFPTDPDLLNPSKVDKIISDGLIEDYSLKTNTSEKIPFFYPTFINTTNSELTGKFINQR